MFPPQMTSGDRQFSGEGGISFLRLFILFTDPHSSLWIKFKNHDFAAIKNLFKKLFEWRSNQKTATFHAQGFPQMLISYEKTPFFT